MHQQTTLNGRTAEPSPAAAVSRNLADFLHDILTLIELQIQLFGVDLREAVQRSILPVVLLAGAAVITVACVPLVLMGIVWTLVLRAGLSQDVAFFATALGGIVIAVIMGVVAWQSFAHLGPIIERSLQELRQNLLWIKHALRKLRQANDADY